jgi:hypothetical protein
VAGVASSTPKTLTIRDTSGAPGTKLAKNKKTMMINAGGIKAKKYFLLIFMCLIYISILPHNKKHRKGV